MLNCCLLPADASEWAHHISSSAHLEATPDHSLRSEQNNFILIIRSISMPPLSRFKWQKLVIVFYQFGSAAKNWPNVKSNRGPNEISIPWISTAYAVSYYYLHHFCRLIFPPIFDGKFSTANFLRQNDLYDRSLNRPKKNWIKEH